MAAEGWSLEALARVAGVSVHTPAAPGWRLAPLEGAELWQAARPWSPGLAAPLALLGPAHARLPSQAAALWRAAPAPLVVYCQGIEPPPWCAGTPALAHPGEPLAAAALLRRRLLPHLAAWRGVHGTLVAVHGRGLLLVGPPESGKSELALALVERGHRLVADDLVELAALAPERLCGRAPEGRAGHLHLRDLGLLDLEAWRGREAVRPEHPVHGVIQLHRRRAAEARLAPEAEETTLAAVSLPRYHVQARDPLFTAALVESLAGKLKETPCAC